MSKKMLCALLALTLLLTSLCAALAEESWTDLDEDEALAGFDEEDTQTITEKLLDLLGAAPAEEGDLQDRSQEEGGIAVATEEGDLLSQIQEKGEIVVATEGTFAPWNYHDADETLVGFDVEVAQKIAEKLNVSVAFVECEWEGIFAGLEAGLYDIVASSMEITEAREETYDYSIPYGYIRTALVVRGDDEEIASFEDLNGKKVADFSGTQMTLAERYGAEAVGVDTLDQTIEMVLSGGADATLFSEVYFYGYMSAHPDANVKVVALTEDASQVALLVRNDENNASLLEAINRAIAMLSEEGVLSELSVKYFGGDITRASN